MEEKSLILELEFFKDERGYGIYIGGENYSGLKAMGETREEAIEEMRKLLLDDGYINDYFDDMEGIER